ncbi:MAG: radical SAM protein [Thermodesulfobacteriota bacterium]
MVLRYLDARKIRNLILCEWEKLRRVIRPQARPYISIIESTNICRLGCPYCPTGAKRPSGRRKSFIARDQVSRLLDEAGPYLVTANLFNWGEPLLHPEIGALVKLCHDRRLATFISTTLNIADLEVLTQVCQANLDYLIVSISGATQPVYERYHRRGQVHQVWRNLEYLSTLRSRLKLDRPLLDVKYLLFNYNRTEVELARRLARRAGADIFRVLKAGGAAEDVIEGANRTPPEGLQPGLCHHLWQSVTLNADGSLPPCCYLYFQEDDFADSFSGGLVELRSNDLFVTARKFFNPAAVSELPPNLRHPCLKCNLVHQQPHLQEYLKTNPLARLGHRTGGP